ncbi:MAG: protein kinase, partial [Merismopedia sp. SIO2A8]|nr:protein kinase [Merismopedia sp. SIO2A8]
MSYCLNPTCPSPVNPPVARYCQSCGTELGLVNQYCIDKVLGTGGFGRTFLAQDLARRQLCVIKQLQPLFPPQNFYSPQNLPSPCAPPAHVSPAHAPQALPRFSAAELERFRQEVQRLDELGHHPQIPTLWDAVEHPVTPFPALYIVQEFIPGNTLEDDLNTHGPWSELKVRSLLTSILPVLQFIHDHHVIHRDIKPQNIICPPDTHPFNSSSSDFSPSNSSSSNSSSSNSPSSDSHPFKQSSSFILVDFGAAKRTSRTRMDNTGTVIGSAGYAAPEQTMVLGYRQKVHRSPPRRQESFERSLLLRSPHRCGPGRPRQYPRAPSPFPSLRFPNFSGSYWHPIPPSFLGLAGYERRQSRWEM